MYQGNCVIAVRQLVHSIISLHVLYYTKVNVNYNFFKMGENGAILLKYFNQITIKHAAFFGKFH